MLKLAIISDIHHGTSKGTRCSSDALRLVDGFLEHVAQTNPDYVVELGDRILDVSAEEDKILLEQIANSLRQIKQPKAHLLGNHDIDKLSLKDNEKILDCSLESRSIDVNGYHLVFWNCNTKLLEKDYTVLEKHHLEWLRKDLAETVLPTIIFTHFPLDSGSMIGNYFFQKEYACHVGYSPQQCEEIREVIEMSNKVILCVNGHTHWNAYKTIDGIHYVTIPSLTESFPTFPDPNEAWADIMIDQTIEIEVHGRTPMFYRLPIKQSGKHWAHKFKSYAPKPLDL